MLDYLKSHPKQDRGPILKAAESAGKNQGSIGLLLVKLAKDGKISVVQPAGPRVACFIHWPDSD